MKKYSFLKLALAFCIPALGFTNSFASECPTLSVDEVRNFIEMGSTYTSGTTLMDEAGATAEEIKKQEPTANPYDTYYTTLSHTSRGHNIYLVHIGNTLASSIQEAKQRLLKILTLNYTTFSGKSIGSTMCSYSEIQASKSIPGYPFKSIYESISLNLIKM